MNEQPPGDAASAFKARLDALRSKGPPPSVAPPSLKERLQQAEATRPSNPEDLKARIQSRFQNKTAKPSLGTASPNPVAETPAQSPVHFDEVHDLPTAPKKQEDKSNDLWSLEQGGICPDCKNFNVAGVVFCAICGYMLLRSEVEVEIVTSYPLKDIKGLAHTFVNKLEELNIRTTEDILRVGCSRKNRDTISKRTGLSERTLLRLVHTSDICRVPSMGPENAAMLELLAINSLADMLKLKPLDLHSKIHQNRIKINQQGIIFMPTKNQVNQWFDEARALPAIRIT